MCYFSFFILLLSVEVSTVFVFVCVRWRSDFASEENWKSLTCSEVSNGKVGLKNRIKLYSW